MTDFVKWCADKRLEAEPTTESHDAALEFAAAWERTGRDALSDEAIRGVALTLDQITGAAVDPLVQVFRTLPLNGDAGCDRLTDAEWLTVANAARDELAKIGWQVGPIETPAPAHPLTYEQAIENCARLMDTWGIVGAGTAMRNRAYLSDKYRAFIAEYRRQTSALAGGRS